MSGTSDKIMGLLNNPRMMDFGMGLLSAGGPSFTPHNVGQDIASAYQYANGREGQRAQLEMQRAQLSQQKKQAQARAQLAKAIANPPRNPQQIGQAVMGQMGITGSGPGMLNPQTQAQYRQQTGWGNMVHQNKQNQMPGLLMEAFPNQAGPVMAGLLGGGQSGAKNSTAYNDLEDVLGRPPTMAELSAHENPSDPFKDAQLTALTSEMQEDLERRRREDADRLTQKQIVAAGVESGITDMVKLFEINDKLDNTLLQSGLPFEDWRKAIAGGQELAADFFGLDSSKIEDLNSSYGLFKKISNDFALNSMDRLSGTGSKFQLQSSMDANAGLSAAPGANKYVIAGNLEELMMQARVRGITIPEATRRDAQKIIDSVNGSSTMSYKDL